MADFQVVHHQFTSNDNGRSLDAKPATIPFLRFQDIAVGFWDRSRTVERVVLQLDQVTVVQDGMWNPNLLAEALCQAASDGRLSVAWRPEQEHSRVAVNGWAKLIEQVILVRDL